MSANQPYVVAPGESERRWMGATFTDFIAPGDRIGGRFALVEEFAPKGVGAPLHRHPADDEAFYVLEGAMTFFIGDRTPRPGTPGTFVNVPAGTVHGFRIDSEAARYLILTTPRHADFYRAITAAAADGGAGAKISKEVVGQACRDFGVEFVGPLPT